MEEVDPLEAVETRYRLVPCPRCQGRGTDPEQVRMMKVRGGVTYFPARCRLCLNLGMVFEGVPLEAYDLEAKDKPKEARI